MAGGGARNWLGVGLASGQVALALALVVGAGLVLGGLDRAVNGALGFDKRHVITAQLRLTTPAYEDNAERRRQFADRVLERLRGIPAVETLAVSSSLPYTAGFQTRPIYPEGQPLTDAEVRQARWVSISPDYFTTMRIPLLEGRPFAESDREDTPQVAIVSRAFADRYWPGVSPVGRRFGTAANGPWFEVVGVSGDVVQDLLDLPMSRYDIADYLGLTVETVSRVLSMFKRDGAIGIPTPQRIELLDRDALEAAGEA